MTAAARRADKYFVYNHDKMTREWTSRKGTRTPARRGGRLLKHGYSNKNTPTRKPQAENGHLETTTRWTPSYRSSLPTGARRRKDHPSQRRRATENAARAATWHH